MMSNTSNLLVILSVQRKLKQPEYNDVDDKHKVAMIKHTTTKIAAEDLKDKVRYLMEILFPAISSADRNSLLFRRLFCNSTGSRFERSTRSSVNFG
jgi:hypothetical protein